MKNSLVVLIINVSIGLSPVAAQSSSENTIYALLSEVRQLRLALEKSALVAPKIQVTLQRMPLQQESVARVSRQLEDVRDQLAKSANEEAAATGQLKDAEARAAQEQDPAKRKQAEDEIKAFKSMLDHKLTQQRTNDAHQRSRESELAGRLQFEQAKLNELNDRITALERMLEPAPPQPKQP